MHGNLNIKWPKVLHRPRNQNICSLIQRGKSILYCLVTYFNWSVELCTVYNKSCYPLLTTCSMNLQNESTETTEVFLKIKWAESDKKQESVFKVIRFRIQIY